MSAQTPMNLDAEEAVIGSCLLSDSAIMACSEVVRPADFYRGSHGRIYETILALYADSVSVNPITVVDALDKRGWLDDVGGRSRVNELAALVPQTASAKHWAEIVADLASMRALVRAGQEIARLGLERNGDAREIVDQAEQLMFDAARKRTDDDFVPVSETLAAAYQQVRAVSESGKRVIGLPTGFRRLDLCTSGLQPGNLIVVAGRPSIGKSSVALCIVAHVALREKVPVALFTLEMSRAEVTQRLMSSEALVDSHKIRNGRLDKDDWDRLAVACGRIDKAPLFIDDSGAVTAMEIRSKARRLKLRQPDLGLIVVDYLQLMGSVEGAAENRVQAISQISRALKLLARDLEVPVIAVSQLSRAPEQRHDKRPILSDLRESGSIEQDADVVMFLYRDEYYHPEDTDAVGVAELNVAKHRNGPTDLVKLAFRKEYVRFTDLVVVP